MSAKFRSNRSANSGDPTATPGPSPERAIYGFALFLTAVGCAGIYLIWAFVPPEVLWKAGIDFLPNQYWAVVIPLCICSLIFVIPAFYGLICLRLMPAGGLEDISVDKYSRPEIYEQVLRTPHGGIPPLCDIPLEFLQKNDHELFQGDGNRSALCQFPHINKEYFAMGRAAEIGAVFGTAFVVIFAIGIYDVLFNFEANRCAMTYMFEYPDYVPIKLDENTSHQFPKYGLYLYSEGERTEQYYRKVEANKKLSGIPVLYIPGNAGSYKQARSLGSVLLRMAAKRQNRPHFDVFTLNLNEELAGLYGGFLNRQTQFVHRALRKISSMYSSKNRHKIFLFAHSVGGIIARGLFLNPEFETSSVNTIFTLSTPHQPIVLVDSDIEEYYNQTNEYWISSMEKVLKNVVLVSFASGHRDVLVRSERSDLSRMFPNHPRMLSMTTTSVPSVWASTDHLCIVWCKQLVIATARALFSMVDPITNRLTDDPERRLEVARNYFVNPDYLRTSFGDINHEQKEIPVKFSDGYNVSLQTRKYEGPFYQFVYLDNLENEEILIQSSFWSEKWISICQNEKCAESTTVEMHPLRIPWFSEDESFVAVLSNISNIVPVVGGSLRLEIPKRDDVLELEVFRIAGRPEVKTVTFFDGFRDVTRANLANTKYFRLNVDLQEIWQVLYIELRMNEKCIEKRGLIRFHVPGFPQDTYKLMTENFVRSSMKLQVQKIGDEMSTLELFLNPECDYEVKIGVSWQEIFGQVVRFCVVQLPAFLAAVVVLETLSLYRDRGNTVIDHLVLNGIVLCFLLAKSLFPEEFQPEVGFSGSSLVPSTLIWIVFYGVSMAIVAIVKFAIYLTVAVYSYPTYFLLKPVIRRVQSVRAKLAPGYARALLFPVFSVTAAGISYMSCGENGLVFALVIYFLKICYLKRNAVLSTGPAEDIREHTQLLLLALLTTLINCIPTLVWTKQLPSGIIELWRSNMSQLDPDPSFTVAILVGVVLDFSIQLPAFKKISKATSHLFDLMGIAVVYGVSTGLLLYAQNVFYLINEFLKILFTFLSVDFIRRVFLL